MAAPPDPSDERLLEALRGSQPVKLMVEQDHQREVIERQAHLDAIAVIDQEAEKAAPKWDAMLADLLRKVRDAEKALQVAKDKHAEGFRAKQNDLILRSLERRRHETALIERAVPEIDAFKSWCRAERQSTRKQLESVSGIERNQITGKMVSHGANNLASIKLRMAALAAALNDVEALRFVADPSTIPARLEAMRAGIPAVLPAKLEDS